MLGSSQALYVAIPASAAARDAPPAVPARDGSPRRDSRRRRGVGLVLALASCGLAAFIGWALSRDRSDLETRHASACYRPNCAALSARFSHPLPREWRWTRKEIEYEHMYRE